MKHIITMLIFIMMTSLAFAEPINYGCGSASSNTGGGGIIRNDVAQSDVDDYGNTILKLKGLENAVLKVKNEETQAKLELVWSNVNQNTKTKLNSLQKVIFGESSEGKIIIEAQEQAMFLGLFKIKKIVSLVWMKKGMLSGT